MSDEARLQAFFAANPEYFMSVQGEPATPSDARDEIDGELPEGLIYTKKWVIGYVNPDESLAALANVIENIFVPSVWNVSTFIVATSRHGSGDAQSLYRGLESWAAANGARWLRLGVVQGNSRAERFWTTCGYIETRRREGFKIGNQVNTLRVMFKPLTGGSVQEYLALVQRDRPQ
jgi:GNAT superfamily N-acetyltransferase